MSCIRNARNVLDIMLKTRLSAGVDQTYRRRALKTIFVACPCLRLSPDFIEYLKRASNCSALRRPRLPPGRSCRQLLSRAHRFRKDSENYPGGEWFSRISLAATTSAKSGSSAAAFDRDLHCSRSRRTRSNLGNDSRYGCAFPQRRTGLEPLRRAPRGKSAAHANGSRRPHRSISSRKDDGSAEPADLDCRIARALRCMRQCLRRCAYGITRLIRDGLRFDQYLVARVADSAATAVHGGAPSARSQAQFSRSHYEDWCMAAASARQNCPYATSICNPFEVNG